MFPPPSLSSPSDDESASSSVVYAPPSSSSPSDDESASSSVVYDHEPFVTFRTRVLALAASSIWPDSDPDEITVERLPGGGFNRIIGLTRQRSNAQLDTKIQYILRIPRFDAAQVDLYSSFPNLSHEERCRVARELGAIFNQMLAVRSSMAGKLVLPTDRSSLQTPVHVTPLASTDSKLARPYSDSAPSESTHELLSAIFLSRKATELERNPSDTVGPKLWDQFYQMTSELEAGGWLVDRYYSIAHLDLAPRNILVNPTANSQLPIISGILDWDSAVLAPPVMSCTPPMWIWAWQDDEDEDERAANGDPPTREGQQLKSTFEEAAGQNYIRLAYEPAYRLARRLVPFAIEGVPSNEDFKEAEAMLRDWTRVSQS